MTFKIGLCGAKGAGKSILAGQLIKHLPDAAHLHALHTWYDACAELLGVPRWYLEGADTKDLPWTEGTAPIPCLVGRKPRDLADHAGNAFRGEFGETFFAELWERKARGYRYAINSAVRFPYEARGMDVVLEMVSDGVTYDGSYFNTRLDATYINAQVTWGCAQTLAQWIMRKERERAQK